MPTLRRYTVVPRLPSSLERLRDIAHNLWWAWAPEGRDVFVRLDPDLWEEVHGNPVELLSRVHQRRLDEMAKDDAYLAQLDAAWKSLEHYMSREGWFQKKFPELASTRIAYFSMEYGLHQSLPVYSGGLGVLAGDHLKTASDLGLPLVGIGLAYAEGYFRQFLNDDGWQHERYPLNDWHRLPVRAVMGADGKRLIIDVEYPDRVVHAQLWRVQVGRVPLYLLDANLESNAPADRSITGPLYGGDQEFRVRQEVMLGIGGVHALEALGLSPTVCHMNEGHSAFLALERIARVMRDKGVPFAVAREATATGNIFTTHTPVPAGNDRFPRELVLRYLDPCRRALKLSEDELLSLGRDQSDERIFSMPVFAIRAADKYNGVSALHGDVSRRMYQPLWPDVPEHEVPIGSVTNGVHTASWISDEMGALFTRYLGPRWTEQPDDHALWARVHEIPDAELWQTHEHRRYRLVTLCRQWLSNAAVRRNAGEDERHRCEEVLDPRALTIGFARRFATYKRATLLFTELERVKRLLSATDRPVQLIFAGKAHPQDRGGKELIRDIVHASRDAGLRGRVVFIEDYDMRIARALVSGVDVWLNTPRRPLEASGTSGMKAAANGALNVSVLDGWWAEAWRDHGWEVGWAIGRGEEYTDGAGDRTEAELLYDVLEREVVPLFFDRETQGGLPRRWIKRMKNAIARLAPTYNTGRMVKEYSEHYYVPCIEQARRLTSNDLRAARALAGWRSTVTEAWPEISVRSVTWKSPDEIRIGERADVEAIVHLGALRPEDVCVELYYGPTSGGFDLHKGSVSPMKLVSKADGGQFVFAGSIPAVESGTHAFAARVVPRNAEFGSAIRMPLMRWA